MKKHNSACIFFIAFVILVSCADRKKEEETPGKGVETVLPDTKNEVAVMTLVKQNFHHELMSNGKVVAKGQADLRFENSEVVAHIFVKNGDRVRKGQKIAELDKFRLANRLAQAEDALERARLELQDVLIGQGYKMEDFNKVPADIMKLAKVKSGYEQSKIQYDLAKQEEKQATLIAPFDGTVANLFAKPHNLANTTDVFCTIVDTQGMEADFTVLESELPLLKTGDKVVVTPYADAASVYEGSVSEINPLVDDKGMVKVRARVNGKGKLFSGMNVRVSVKRSLGPQLVIPKSAVVLRSGKKVVFTLDKGKAFWNYVQTGFENADSCVVASKEDGGVTNGLKEGDVVIVSGNVNLAHEAPVTVMK